MTPAGPAWTAPLEWLARHGRLVLVAGLALGIVLPGLARAMEPLIAPLIGLLLFLAALRIGPGALSLGRAGNGPPPPGSGPRAMRPAAAGLGRVLGLTLLLQTALPLAALGMLAAAGWAGGVVGTGLVLMFAAAPITGSPGLAILSGADPAPALRQLVLGTALLPLTVLPVFWLMPVFPEPGATLAAAGRLLVLIAGASAGAFLLRRAVPALAAPGSAAAMDGATTLVMAAVVVALMSAVGPALLAGEGALWAILLLVFAVNFGTQLAVHAGFRRLGEKRAAPAMGIVAGNRNLALFLTALPPETVEALLLFVGCAQVPMYVTPYVMGRLYRRGLP